MSQKQDEKIDQLVEMLSQLSVLDMSKLKKALEEKWDVTASAGVSMMMAPPAAQEGGSKEEESTDFQIVLEEFPPDKKIAVIKIVREVASLSLTEAKALVEGAPSTVKESSPKEEAEEIKKKFVDVGAKVTLKGV